MKLAVFSDIHGNFTALEAFMADLESVGPVDYIWCLGDLAALGPRPANCIRHIRTWRESFGKEKFPVIGGNADRYLITGERLRIPLAKDAEAFAKRAADWQARDSVLNWNVAQLGWEDYEWLAKRLGRETGLDVDGYGHVIGYHAIPGDDEVFITPDTPNEEAADALLDREGWLAIGAHTHVQMDRQINGWRMVNVGSIGMSFQMPGKAQWGLFTFENGEVDVDLRAVPYDVDAFIADLHDSGCPEVDWVLGRFILNG